MIFLPMSGGTNTIRNTFNHIVKKH